MRIKSKGTIPYGGLWPYVVPETKMKFQATLFEQLLPKVIEHRKAMGLHIGLGLEAEIEKYCCEQLPDECTDLDPSFHPVKLTFEDVLHGTSVLMSLIASGGGLVDDHEASRRAEICAECKLNVSYSVGCTGCAALTKLVTTMVGGKKTAFDDNLKACGICHCVNKAHIWVPLEHLAKGVTDAMRADFKKVTKCWKQL